MIEFARPTMGRILPCAFLVLALSASHLVAQDAPPELTPGMDLIRDRDWDAAADWFYSFTRENPGHAEARRQQGFVELHRRDGDLVRARQYLDAAVSAEPDHPIGLMLLGRVCVISEDTQCAVRSFDRIIELGPGERDPMRSGAVHLARFNRGLLHAEAGEADEAREKFEAVLRREPVHAYASFEMGLIEKEAGNLEAALERFQTAYRNLNRWTALEIWAIPQGRYSYARDDVSYELARALVASGRAEEARPLLQPLVDLARARNSSRQVTQKKSERSLLECDIEPRFENSLYAWGEMLEALGETRDAAKAYKEFARMKFGDDELKSEAKRKAKELR